MQKFFAIMAFCLALSLVWTAPGRAQESKVGFVNPQRIINESKIGRIAQEDLAEIGKEKDRRVREALAEVDRIKGKLDQEKPLSVSEEQMLERSMRLAVREYENLVQRSNQDIQGEERLLIEFVMRRSDSILRALAAEMGFTIILTDPEIIGYVAPAVDITDRVIRELNRMM